jgi:serine/threonine-protein kinase HipA
MVFSDERALVLARYDRAIGPDGQVMRVHQEDICQALGYPPSRKYERGDGGPGILDMVQLVRRVQPLSRSRRAIEHYVKALAYNWLIYGPDAHAKNYSLLLSGSEVAPSPLYDVSSVLSYPQAFNLRQMAMAMSVNGKYQNSLIHREDWVALAARLDLDADMVLTWVRDLAERAPDAFDAAARADHEVIGDLAVVRDLVENVARCSHELSRYL